MTDISEIGEKLNERAEEVARMLLPNGQRFGSEWRAGSVNGENGTSLAVHLSGTKTGVWKDFATDEKGADLLDLWAKVKGVGLGDAVREAKSFLGLQSPQFIGSRPRQYRKPDKPRCKKVTEQSAVMKYLVEERKLSLESIAAYCLAEMQTDKGPTIVLPFKREDELVNVKYLAVSRDETNKKQSWFESGCLLTLFGWQVVPEDAREVLICEGELDALSWYQYGIPALSVPNGARSFTWIENEYENLERFSVIYLSWDMDSDGRAGVAEAVDRLGRHRCRVVDLPHKDANECLKADVTKEQMLSFYDSAQSRDPAELKRASVYVEEVIEEFYPSGGKVPGFLTPWTKLDQLLRFRPSELSIWSGFNDSGKTTMLNQIILAGMAQDERACIASLEVKPRKLLKRMTRQATARRQPDVLHIRAAHDWYDDKLWMFELVGSTKAERLLNVFEYARRRYGITQFVLDSLMRCGIGEDDYNGQKNFVDQLAEFATSHDVHFHLVAHSKKRDSDAHKSSRLDVKGSGTITDLAHNVFIVWRNKEKEKAIEDAHTLGMNVPHDVLSSPDALLICDKTREGEWEGKAGLWFDVETYQYVEAMTASALVYVPHPVECYLKEEELA